MRVAFVVILALLGTVLAVPKHEQRIVGGVPTTVDQYPYITNLQVLWGGIVWSQSCGGSLITVQTVLTAAHCFVNSNTGAVASPNSWRVRAGTSFRSSGGSVHNLVHIHPHERYNDPQLTNDVALLRLAISVTLSQYIQMARIAGPNYILSDNTQVTTLGWGTLTPGGSTPEQLQVVDLYTINHQLCTQRYAYLKTMPGFQNWPDITPDMICAGVLDVGGRDACQGDSGGPLAHDRDVLVGVVSWGYSCAHSYWPGVNARVSYFSDWIVANA